jgi:hypothetical protein
MPHWDHRPEPRFAQFRFRQPYAKGLRRLREDVLGKTDFDPATLWQWGTMQAMALIGVLRAAEARYGADGQALVKDALHAVGLDVGRQILDGAEIPEDATPAEIMSFYATIINRVAYASLEAPRMDGPEQVSFDILWCPHQDHYGAFDCRIQRYFVEGMLEAARDRFGDHGFEVRFDTTIPSGAETCHFTLWKGSPEERDAWRDMTRLLDAKALVRAKKVTP